MSAADRIQGSRRHREPNVHRGTASKLEPAPDLDIDEGTLARRQRRLRNRWEYGSMKPKSKITLSPNKHDWHPSPLPGQVVLVTTLDERGQPNVATKSWISMVAFGPPPVVLFGCNEDHATARNVRAMGKFVINIPGIELAETCWALGSDSSVQGPERLQKYGITTMSSEKVKPPRLLECRAHLECELDGMRSWGKELAIFGRIVAASLDAELMEGSELARYSTMTPFFFLENGWAAPLGPAQQVQPPV